MLQKLLIAALLGFISFPSILLNNSKTASETLILFNDRNSPMQTEAIAKIADLAKEMQLDFVVKDAKDGLPQEVTTLPSIYFQNKKGRSKYYGRYSNISRLQNFIRISKMAHQKNEVNEKKAILVWKEGRADVTAPIKITDLGGELNGNFDQVAFKAEAKQAIVKGMQKFKLLPTHNLTKNTRSFYFNFYPYRSASDELFLTAEIFSQYNCVKPIFRQLKPALIKTKWADRAQAFEDAAKLIEAEIMDQITNSNLGDAFIPVTDTVELTSWDALELALPKEDLANKKKYDRSIKIPQKWQVEERGNTDDPIVIFSFLSPVDNYAGEVKKLSGTLELATDLSMKGAIGKFEVQVSDVTMGAEDFDNEVQNKMLKMGVFPDAHFEFVAIKQATEPLALGVAQELLIQGKFTMIGISTTVDVETTIEPFLDEKDTPKLRVNCTFQLPLFDTFKLDGPDGPSPAKDILQFYMQFNLVSV